MVNDLGFMVSVGQDLADLADNKVNVSDENDDRGI